MTKKILPLLVLALGLLGAQTTWAHSSMTMTPENGAILNIAPEFIEIKFSKMVKMLKFNIVDAKGNEVNYASENQRKFTDKYKANLSTLTAGEYFITWRAMGKDGHPMKSKFSFSIK